MFYGKDAYRKRELHGQSSGSGVSISQDGYIVTNNHVIENADQIMITLKDGRQLEAKKLGSDAKSDIKSCNNIEVNNYKLDRYINAIETDGYVYDDMERKLLKLFLKLLLMIGILF